MSNHPNRSKTLSLRSKITVRWTTNPADMGYDGRPSDWRTAPGETMSIRNALDFAHALAQRVGAGTYKLISYQHRGRDVSIDEIRAVVESADYAQ